MYHAHFGLKKGLFGDGIATESTVFRSPKHDQIIANFKLALGSPSSAIVLRGPAGVGKTTLTSAALRASSTRLALAWLNGTPTNSAELLELVLVELGIATVRTTRIERLQLWRQFHAETRATESRLFIVVERTEDLAPEVLHALDALTAPDAAGNLGANVVLLGHATIDEHLAAPVLESFRQRIRLRAELTPFTEGELQDYLRHQVACAGGHFDHVFAPGTVAALYRHSRGVARLANTLCETALDIAANQKQKLLTPELVIDTAVSVLGLADAAPAARVITPAAQPEPVAAKAAPAPLPAAATVSTPAPVPAPPPPPQSIAPPVVPAPATPDPVIAVATPAPPPTAPVIVAAATPAAAATPTPTVVASPPAVPSVVAATVAVPASAPAPSPAVSAPQPTRVEFEYDGGATDITDVAMADFPVLTDAVEMPVAPVFKRTIAPAPLPQAALPQAPSPVAPVAVTPPTPPMPAPRAPAQPTAAPPPVSRPTTPSRVETAYAAKAPVQPKAAPAAASAAAAPPPTSAPAKVPVPAAAPRTPPLDPDSDDVLRQTQTMRAISVAKSIDDISSSMAETLFGDAELDLMTAALASAAEWPADDEQPAAAAKPAPAPAPSKPQAAERPAPIDDPFDLFGLGDDAPLELIDDSVQAPNDQTRKTAAR
jgi:type II secretory pathway predicted ATPase ExeA